LVLISLRWGRGILIIISLLFLFYLINKTPSKNALKISTLPFLLPNTLSLKFEAILLVNTIVFWVNNMYDEQAENN
jgi:hypothetical protein